VLLSVVAPSTSNVPVKSAELRYIFCVAEIEPTTVNFSFGSKVPTPTFPEPLTIKAVSVPSLNSATSLEPST